MKSLKNVFVRFYKNILDRNKMSNSNYFKLEERNKIVICSIIRRYDEEKEMDYKIKSLQMSVLRINENQ